MTTLTREMQQLFVECLVMSEFYIITFHLSTYIQVLLLALYYTVQTFNDPEKDAF